MTRLVCFHHAGGGASAFRGWHAALPPDTMYAVQLPGREDRHGEPRHVALTPLIDALVPELEDLLAQPHVLFGHSMGALVAYYVARQRIAAGRRPPERLVVAARAAPHLDRRLFDADMMSDAELGAALHRIGGMPAELLRRPDWLGPLLAVVRDDIKVCNSHRHTPGTPLPCPIDVFGGRHDPLVSESDLHAWADHTTAACSVTMLDAGHFLVQDPAANLRDQVLHHIGRTNRPPRSIRSSPTAQRSEAAAVTSPPSAR